jgi:6-phosphogluconolactonase (cycloisomerase 2 family)
LGKLYVTNQDSNSILRFDNALNATGNVAPGAIITGGATTLAQPQFITLDATADRLYVANANGPSVLIFDGISTKSGNIAPTRSIIGANTQFVTPSSIALDKGRDLLYVADGAEIDVFSPASTVNGDASPTRDIITSFNNIQQVFVDATNDRLYLTDAASNTVAVYDNASTLTGAATPTRSITGAQTQLAQPSGMAIDSSGNLIVTNQGNGTVTVYSNAATATGNQAPVATIGGAATTLSSPAQLIKSSAANEVYIADSTADEVVVFSGIAGLSGNASPTRSIAGAATTLTTGTTARGVALDASR